MSDTIWIVEGRSGEYSDRREWPVAWCATEDEANALLAACVAENASLTEDERYQWPKSPKIKTDANWSNDYPGVMYSVYSLERWKEPR